MIMVVSKHEVVLKLRQTIAFCKAAIQTTMALSEGAKQRLSIVVNITKTAFHYAFLPTVLYLGFKKGADAGMPEITLGNLFW